MRIRAENTKAAPGAAAAGARTAKPSDSEYRQGKTALPRAQLQLTGLSTSTDDAHGARMAPLRTAFGYPSM